jgi:hypothetical protein
MFTYNISPQKIVQNEMFRGGRRIRPPWDKLSQWTSWTLGRCVRCSFRECQNVTRTSERGRSIKAPCSVTLMILSGRRDYPIAPPFKRPECQADCKNVCSSYLAPHSPRPQHLWCETIGKIWLANGHPPAGKKLFTLWTQRDELFMTVQTKPRGTLPSLNPFWMGRYTYIVQHYPIL